MNSLRNAITALQANIYYAFVIAFLAIIGAGLLMYEFFSAPSAEVIVVLQKIDLVIAGIFLVDFFLGLYAAGKNGRNKYWRYNWINLIASIPVTSDVLRALRILRLLRALRVIRAGVDVWFATKRYSSLKRQHKKRRLS